MNGEVLVFHLGLYSPVGAYVRLDPLMKYLYFRRNYRAQSLQREAAQDFYLRGTSEYEILH